MPVSYIVKQSQKISHFLHRFVVMPHHVLKNCILSTLRL